MAKQNKAGSRREIQRSLGHDEARRRSRGSALWGNGGRGGAILLALHRRARDPACGARRPDRPSGSRPSEGTGANEGVVDPDALPRQAKASPNGTFRVIVQGDCGQTRTRSRAGVADVAAPSPIASSPAGQARRRRRQKAQDDVRQGRRQRGEGQAGRGRRRDKGRARRGQAAADAAKAAQAAAQAKSAAEQAEAAADQAHDDVANLAAHDPHAADHRPVRLDHGRRGRSPAPRSSRWRPTATARLDHAGRAGAGQRRASGRRRRAGSYAAGVDDSWAKRRDPAIAARMPTIAIVDSGIEDRADFGGRLARLASTSATLPNNSPGDGRGHGTFVAGIAAGAASAHRRGPGREARLDRRHRRQRHGPDERRHPRLRSGSSTTRTKYNIRVANFSLHSAISAPFYLDPLDRAVEQLWFNGVVVVAAAGNYGTDGSPSGVLYSPGRRSRS